MPNTPKMNDPRELFLHELGDLLYVEKTLYKELPKLAQEATDEELSGAFEAHREETKQHAATLEQVFELIGETPKAEQCPGIDGIKQEHDDFIKEEKPSPGGLRPLPDRRRRARRALRDRRLHRPDHDGAGDGRERGRRAAPGEPQAGEGRAREARKGGHAPFTRARDGIAFKRAAGVRPAATLLPPGEQVATGLPWLASRVGRSRWRRRYERRIRSSKPRPSAS